MREREREKKRKDIDPCLICSYTSPTTWPHLCSPPTGYSPLTCDLASQRNRSYSVLWQSSICRLFPFVLLLLIKRSELRARWNGTKTCKYFVFSSSPSLCLYLPPFHLCSCFLPTPHVPQWLSTSPVVHSKPNVSSHWIAFQNILSLYGFHCQINL